jgi:hypothetical protein
MPILDFMMFTSNRQTVCLVVTVRYTLT